MVFRKPMPAGAGRGRPISGGTGASWRLEAEGIIRKSPETNKLSTFQVDPVIHEQLPNLLGEQIPRPRIGCFSAGLEGHYYRTDKPWLSSTEKRFRPRVPMSDSQPSGLVPNANARHHAVG